MKSILSLFACLCMAGCAFGSNPSFQSFDTNDFLILPSISNPNKIRLNGTLGVTNIYATNITVNNLYATNIFTTNIFSFSTNTFVTNLTVVELTVITNVTIGGTNVAVINPTDGRYPYRASSNSFGDGAITHIDATTAGVEEMDIGDLVVTNLMAGGVVISTATVGSLTNIPAGAGVLVNDGANNFSWGAAGTTINPTDRFIPYRANGTTFGDSPWFVIATNKLGFLGTSTNAFVSVDGSDNMGVGYQSINSVTSGSFNTAFGTESGKSITSGNANTLFGYRTGRTIVDGANNTLFGYASGPVITSGYDNVGIGTSALNANQLGYGQIGIGSTALLNAGQGGGASEPSFNTAIGHSAGAKIYLSGTLGGVTNASFNTLIGAYSTTLNDATNAIGLGFRSVVTNSNEIVIGNTNNTKAIFPITSYSGAGTLVLTDDGTYKSVSSAGGLAINPTDYYIPFRTNSTTFLNSPWYVTSTNVALDSKLILGPGTTNSIYRDSAGIDTVVDMPAAVGVGAYLQVKRGANTTYFGTTTAGGALVQSPSNLAILAVGSAYAEWDGTSFQPTTTAKNLGNTSGYGWKQVDIEGFNNGSGDYSRMLVSHSGTNGSAILNSQANGTAGAARPIDVQVGGTNVMVYKADRQEFYNDGAKKWTMISGNLYPESANDIGTSLNPIGYLYAGGAQIGSCLILSGAGSPEGVKTAPVGSLYMRSDGGANTSLYVKETGSGNTGWVGK